MTSAIILCGGQGKRLRPLTDNIPKCLLPINGKPLLEFQVDLLRKHGVDTIILACGYMSDMLKEKYGDQFIYSVEDKPLGTGGALKKALEFVKDEEFFLVYCDEITDIDLDKLKALGSNTIVVSTFNCRFGIVELDGEKVKHFKQKPILDNIWASIGFYYLNKNIKNELPAEGSMERTLFENPKFKLKAYKHTGTWLTVNTRKDKEEAEKFLKEHPLV